MVRESHAAPELTRRPDGPRGPREHPVTRGREPVCARPASRADDALAQSGGRSHRRACAAAFAPRWHARAARRDERLGARAVLSYGRRARAAPRARRPRTHPPFSRGIPAGGGAAAGAPPFARRPTPGGHPRRARADAPLGERPGPPNRDRAGGRRESRLAIVGAHPAARGDQRSAASRSSPSILCRRNLSAGPSVACRSRRCDT